MDTTTPLLEQANCSASLQHRPVYVAVDNDDGPQYGPIPCPYCADEAERYLTRRARGRDRHEMRRLGRRYEHLLATGTELPAIADRPRGGVGPQEALRCRPIRARLVTQLREAVVIWSTVPDANVVTGSATEPGIVDDGHLVAWDRTENGTIVVVRQSDLPDLIGVWPPGACATPKLANWELELEGC